MGRLVFVEGNELYGAGLDYGLWYATVSLVQYPIDTPSGPMDTERDLVTANKITTSDSNDDDEFAPRTAFESDTMAAFGMSCPRLQYPRNSVPATVPKMQYPRSCLRQLDPDDGYVERPGDGESDDHV